jgi:hypothetical protein
MFFCNLEHTAKEAIKTRSGKVKNAPTAKAVSLHHSNVALQKYKENTSEKIEFVDREICRILRKENRLSFGEQPIFMNEAMDELVQVWWWHCQRS